MKIKFGSVLIVMLSTLSLLADKAMPPAETPASTNAPAAPIVAPPAAKKAAPKTTAKKKTIRTAKAPEPRTVPLVAGPAVVAVGHGPVNVRTRPGLAGEVVARMTNGEPVTVMEEINLKRSGPDEPSAWAKIILPAGAHAWVNSAFINPADKTVKARTKLNVRGGPGENYGVIGSLQPGETIKEVSTKDNWIEIEAPANGYAFMAAQYLKQEAPGTLVAEVPVEPTPAAVPESPTVAPTTETPAPTPTMETPAVTPAPPEPAVEEPPPPRIVQREGLVRGTFSIQAPTRYELISADTKRPINYLHTTSPNLDLSRYKGLHIIVTGEEGLDERWRNTPVITIRRIQVIE